MTIYKCSGRYFDEELYYDEDEDGGDMYEDDLWHPELCWNRHKCPLYAGIQVQCDDTLARFASESRRKIWIPPYRVLNDNPDWNSTCPMQELREHVEMVRQDK